MERLRTLSQAELPDHLRWQAVSFLRVVWPDVDGGALRASYPPSLDPVHHLVADDDLLLAYAATFVQVLEVGGTAVRVGCLGNVLTFPGSRRRGHGRAVVEAATRHLRGGGVDLGALLCDPGLVGFYAAAGWLPSSGASLVDDPDGGRAGAVDALRMVLPVSARGRAGGRGPERTAAGAVPLVRGWEDRGRATARPPARGTPMDTALPAVAVTGVTGAVGGLVARALADQGVPLRLLARTPDRAPELPGCVVLPSRYGDGEPSVAALRGVSTLFMVSAAEHEERLGQHRAFVAAAAEAGVQQVVYTSFAAAAEDAVFTLGRDHWATERAIVDAGLAHTFLRDSFYLDFLPETVGEDGVIRGPAGDGRVAAVARADVARAATAVLQDPEPHRGATYELTGPEALSFADVAAQVSAARGRPVTYRDETLEEAYASRARYGAPRWQVDAWVSTYTAIATGRLARVTDDVQRITGQAPLTLAQLLARA